MRTDRKPRKATSKHADVSQSVQLSGPVAKVLARLPAMERDVLTRRVGLHDGHPTSRVEVARALGLGLVELDEIEARAIERLRAVVGPDVARRMLARAS